MSHLLRLRSLYLFMLLIMTTATSAMADAGKDLFEKQCSSCHTIGGGDGGGPDLKGVVAKRPAEWLVRVIVEPDKLTAEKDATQAELVKKYGMEMPNLGVSREDARKIVAFLQGGNGPAPAAGSGAAPGGADTAATPAAPQDQKKEVVVTKELLAEGVALFNGKKPFSKGGPPCVSCHSLSYPGIYGGALAADLTQMHAKMGDAGVQGVLKGLSFPIMKKAYADRPLSDEEITSLTALFKDASRKQERPSEPYPVAALGFFGALVIGLVAFKRRIG